MKKRILQQKRIALPKEKRWIYGFTDSKKALCIYTHKRKQHKTLTFSNLQDKGCIYGFILK